jgi:hypothetical protein
MSSSLRTGCDETGIGAADLTVIFIDEVETATRHLAPGLAVTCCRIPRKGVVPELDGPAAETLCGMRWSISCAARGLHLGVGHASGRVASSGEGATLGGRSCHRRGKGRIFWIGIGSAQDVAPMLLASPPAVHAAPTGTCSRLFPFARTP